MALAGAKTVLGIEPFYLFHSHRISVKDQLHLVVAAVPVAVSDRQLQVPPLLLHQQYLGEVHPNQLQINPVG